MQITAKSGVSLEQLIERKNKGAKYIELHLFEEDIKSINSIEGILNNIKEAGVYVKAVHIPIDRRFGIEGLITTEAYSIIENTCNLANAIGELNSEIVCVVMHQELDMSQLNDWGIYNKIFKSLRKILYKYQHISINLENLSMFNVKDDNFGLRSNYTFQTKELCMKLREDLNTDRIGLVLDTCHALSSIRHIKSFYELGLHNETTLKDYFEENKEFLNVIHLANAIDFGYGDGHGVGFDTEEDVEILKEILGLVKEIDFKGLLTLEVAENDYLNCIVFEKLQKQVEEITGQ